ncbi:MAG TPA: phosphatidate cytidylyltransferase [Polyangiaceae bacterium]
MQSNLATRLTTAVLVVPLLVLLLFWGPAWGFYVLVAAATGLAGLELFGMTDPDDRPSQALGALSCVAVSAAMYWFDTRQALLGVLLLTPMLGSLVPLWRLGAIETAGLRVLAHVAGPFYIGALLCTLALMRRDLGAEGPWFVLLTLTAAWFGDTGGYFFGRFLGKRKLYPAVSPKKTVAGFVGALVGALAATLVASFWYLPGLGVLAAAVLGALAGAGGQLGDLVESLLKRATGVKDSGAIIPGHGGLLDRIDAVLFVSPLVYLYALWFGPMAELR